MIADQPPEHMERWTRAERLHRHLLGMGLFVFPIFADAERTRIDHPIVSVALPIAPQTTTPERGETAQDAPSGGISAPVQGAEVHGVVAPADYDGDNVVDFPTVV